ncbi:MAG TPA: hypothetical protein PLT45_11685 [Smithella sp.]|nr:hypothetical protein [Smithella sp.]
MNCLQPVGTEALNSLSIAATRKKRRRAETGLWSWHVHGRQEKA